MEQDKPVESLEFKALKEYYPITYSLMEKTAIEVGKKLDIPHGDAMRFIYRCVVGRNDPVVSMHVLRGMSRDELLEIRRGL